MNKAFPATALAAAVALAFSSSAVASERYIVQLHDGVSADLMAKSLGQEKAGKIHHKFEDQGVIAATLSPEQLKALSRDVRVKSVEVDPKRYPLAQTRPYGIDQVGAPTAWGAGHTGGGVMVCVIDSGIKADHEDFAGLDIRGGYPTGWNSDDCGHGTHVAGTIAAQDNTKGVVGVATGALSMYFVQVFKGASCGWSYASDLIDAANRCKSAADAAGKKLVINMSLGGSTSSTAESSGFQNLYNQGVLSIAAAGNDGVATNPTDAMSYPASYDSVMSVAAIDSGKALADFSQKNSAVEIAAPGVAVLSTYPIASATASVGGTPYSAIALTNTPQLSRSGAIVNGGTCESVGAWSGKVVLCQRGNISFEQKVLNAQSGGGVAAIIYNNTSGALQGTLSSPTGTTIPSVGIPMAEGQEIIASKLGQTASVNTVAQTNVNAYSELSGTSMASPHAAGAAAVIWSSKLTASNADVRSAMTSTAEDLGTAGRDVKFGYGLVNIPAAINALAGPAPDTTAPSVPATASATASSSSAISVSWSASTDTGGSGLAGYKIERCAGSTCTNFAQVGSGTATSFADSGLTASTTYRYRIRSYDNAGNHSGYSSIASATTQAASGGGSTLSNGVAVTGLSGATGAELRYTMTVPAGATNLKFVTTGGTGDADLYVRFGSAPTSTVYDCRSYSSTTAETCNITTAQAGTYHVMVRGYTSFSGVSLTGSYTVASSEPSFFQNTNDFTISDNTTTESSIAVSGRSGNASSALKVAVDIRHTYIGDLIVDLIAPDGSVYNLHNRTGSSTDNIIGTYTVNASSEVANGTWKLRVQDKAAGDVGYINSWSLQF